MPCIRSDPLSASSRFADCRRFREHASRALLAKAYQGSHGLALVEAKR